MESKVQAVETEARDATSWLDRPLIPGLRIDRWTAVYIGLMAVVAFTRLWDLGARSYSHDESIHAWEAWKLLTGRGYTHSPVYHGPFLYHITALFFALFGDSDVTGPAGDVAGGYRDCLCASGDAQVAWEAKASWRPLCSWRSRRCSCIAPGTFVTISSRSSSI